MKVQKLVKVDTDVDVLGAGLLSAEEAEKLLDEEDRKYENWWWLRSPGSTHYFSAFVDRDGSVDYEGDCVNLGLACVRPVLEIKSSELGIGDRFVFGGKIFRVITDRLAFCCENIGRCVFSKNLRAEDANDYEKSDVKKFIDKWYENVVRED